MGLPHRNMMASLLRDQESKQQVLMLMLLCQHCHKSPGGSAGTRRLVHVLPLRR